MGYYVGYAGAMGKFLQAQAGIFIFPEDAPGVGGREQTLVPPGLSGQECSRQDLLLTSMW